MNIKTNLKMNLKTVVLVAMSIWGAGAFASHSLSSNSSDQRQTVSSWTMHLNHYYPSLELTVPSKPMTAQDLSEILGDLKKLEDELHGDLQNERDSLKTLSCSHPTCGDNTRPGSGIK